VSPVVWNDILADQLKHHWDHQLRPRLEGLSDEEYFWEPVPDCWSLRAREDATTSDAAGGGDLVLDYSWPEPTPSPVTTIAWRLAHVTRSCFAARSASHFGGAPADYNTWTYAGTADEALAQLDEQYDVWAAGVAGLGEEGLGRPCGDAEGPFAAYPLAALVTHINREVIHHGAEICLLRDLYLRHEESR
jgi:hypothetical protein